MFVTYNFTNLRMFIRNNKRTLFDQVFNLDKKLHYSVFKAVKVVNDNLLVLFEEGHVLRYRFIKTCFAESRTANRTETLTFKINIDNTSIIHTNKTTNSHCYNGGISVSYLGRKECWCSKHYYGAQCEHKLLNMKALRVSKKPRFAYIACLGHKVNTNDEDDFQIKRHMTIMEKGNFFYVVCKGVLAIYRYATSAAKYDRVKVIRLSTSHHGTILLKLQKLILTRKLPAALEIRSYFGQREKAITRFLGKTYSSIQATGFGNKIIIVGDVADVLIAYYVNGNIRLKLLCDDLRHSLPTVKSVQVTRIDTVCACNNRFTGNSFVFYVLKIT